MALAPGLILGMAVVGLAPGLHGILRVLVAAPAMDVPDRLDRDEDRAIPRRAGRCEPARHGMAQARVRVPARGGLAVRRHDRTADRQGHGRTDHRLAPGREPPAGKEVRSGVADEVGRGSDDGMADVDAAEADRCGPFDPGISVAPDCAASSTSNRSVAAPLSGSRMAVGSSATMMPGVRRSARNRHALHLAPRPDRGGRAEARCLRDRGREEVELLQDDADIRGPPAVARALGQPRDVGPAPADLALPQAFEPGGDVDQRRLARTGRAGHRDPVPGRDTKLGNAQHGGCRTGTAQFDRAEMQGKHAGDLRGQAVQWTALRRRNWLTMPVAGSTTGLPRACPRPRSSGWAAPRSAAGRDRPR